MSRVTIVAMRMSGTGGGGQDRGGIWRDRRDRRLFQFCCGKGWKRHGANSRYDARPVRKGLRKSRGARARTHTHERVRRPGFMSPINSCDSARRFSDLESRLPISPAIPSAHLPPPPLSALHRAHLLLLYPSFYPTTAPPVPFSPPAGTAFRHSAASFLPPSLSRSLSLSLSRSHRGSEAEPRSVCDLLSR